MIIEPLNLSHLSFTWIFQFCPNASAPDTVYDCSSTWSHYPSTTCLKGTGIWNMILHPKISYRKESQWKKSVLPGFETKVKIPQKSFLFSQKRRFWQFLQKCENSDFWDFLQNNARMCDHRDFNLTIPIVHLESLIFVQTRQHPKLPMTAHPKVVTICQSHVRTNEVLVWIYSIT